MSGTILRALRVGSLTFAACGAVLMLAQAAAGYIVVRVLGSVVEQMLG